MFVPEKYPKPCRLNIGNKYIPGKDYLTEEQTKRLLSSRIYIEEKMDGSPVRFETKRFILFAEDLKVRHSIRYKVPARFAIYDFFDKQRGMMLGIDGKIGLYKDLKNIPGFFADGLWADIQIPVSRNSFFLVPLLERGIFKVDELPSFLGLSKYGADAKTKMEGIVVKSMGDAFEPELRSGKLINEEFTKGIEVHYKRKALQYNKIDPSVIEYNPFVIISPIVPLELRIKISPNKN